MIWGKMENLLFLLPVLRTLNTSSSPTARTFGRGTVHLPYIKIRTDTEVDSWSNKSKMQSPTAFSFLFCLTMLLSTFALDWPSLEEEEEG